MKDIKGKVAFISGGASGIGLGMAKAFGAAGMRVVLADIQPQSLDAAQRELTEASVDCLPVALDVTQPSAWKRAAEFSIERFGAVHVLVNNAGLVQGRCPMADVSHELWNRVIDVNLNGVFLGIQTFANRMIAQGEGHIVNTASIYGLMSAAGTGSYGASKYAVVGLSEALCAELAPHGIGVSVLCPGFVKSSIRKNTMEQLTGVLSDKDMPFSGAPVLPYEGMEAISVGERVLTAIVHNELYIVTHPEYRSLVEKRCAAVLAAFGESAQPGYEDAPAFIARGNNPAYLSRTPNC
jgi:NAD(P)-dependent dehydrogenase (short-subunit alcohol dehydrogenase family)